MPDIPERTRKEQQIATPLGGLFAEAALDLQARTPIDWDRFADRVVMILQPTLSETFSETLILLMMQDEAAARVGGLHHEAAGRAGEWATAASRQLADNIAKNIKRDLEGGDAPRVALNQARANAIAATQVTQAGSLGEQRAVEIIRRARAAASQIEDDAFIIPPDLMAVDTAALSVAELPPDATPAMVAAWIAFNNVDDLTAYWNAYNDSRTCPVCSALDGKPESYWIADYPTGPPAHPNCRCWKDYKIGEI